MNSLGEILYLKLFWVTTIVFVVFLYIKHVTYSYWSRKKIPHDTPTLLLGNVPISYFWGKVSHGDLIRKSYEKYKNHQIHGIYLLHEPHLVVNDPELVRLILAKNFQNFTDHAFHCSETKDPLSFALPRQRGDKWKRLRSKLSPTFTSGKLKQMYPLLVEICDELVRVIDGSLTQKTDVLEVADLTSRFTLDCISSIAFGFNCNSLRQPENEFSKHGKISTDFGPIFVLLTFYVPGLVKFYPVPEKRKKVQAFFVQLFDKMVTHRRTEKVIRNDFLNSLMQLMEYGQVEKDDCPDSNQDTANADSKVKTVTEDKISMMEAVAQSVTFIGAGHTTTSAAISCCLHELALNQEIQDKLQEEILEVSGSLGGLTFEKLFEMKYLDMVLCETLRKYPPAAVVNRISAEDIELPGLEFKISKGMKVAISVEGLHRDPDIYPEPEKFDPERFSPENRSKRHPFTYLPFSEGPRQCIGKRLAILKAKIGLYHLLLNYKFTTCAKTREKLKFTSSAFVQEPAGGVYLKVEKSRM